MNRMPEGCSADVYFKKVRPYIFGFTNIIYEGCFDNAPQNYRGETGAQSSIVPTMLRAFGIEHKNSMLTQHLEDMLTYMPAPHREFIRAQHRTCAFDGLQLEMPAAYRACDVLQAHQHARTRFARHGAARVQHLDNDGAPVRREPAAGECAQGRHRISPPAPR